MKPLRICLTAALFAAAGVCYAQPALPDIAPPEAPEPRERRGVVAQGHDHGIAGDPGAIAWRHPDIGIVTSHSAFVFDGELVHQHTFTPPGARILVTEYTFRVHEWFAGGNGQQFFTVREAGGFDAANPGEFMTTCRSHRLDTDGRYIVFLRHDVEESLIPFNRILQVMDGGQTVADERGRIVTELRDMQLMTRRTPEVRSLSYVPDGEAGEGPAMAPPPTPDPGYGPAMASPVIDIAGAPLHAEIILQAIRPAGAKLPTTMPPAGLSSIAQGGVQDWLRCGYIDRSTNFANLIPDNDNWSWTNSAGGDWNDLVDTSHRWIFGSLTSGGNPIRDRLPVANDSTHHRGVPTSAQMIAGGYGGGWSNWSNANGLCFRWYASGSCTRIRETDVFANPTIQSDELQFRKTMVHELGHALGFDHEDRYVAIMVSGTWRVPPNYSSTLYNRTDEMHGGRRMLDVASAQWVRNNWRDMETISQSHPNWGTSGNVQNHMTRLTDYSVSGGQQIAIQRMYVGNRGNLAFGQNLTFRVYFSTNTTITSTDHLVWSGGWPSFAAETVSNNFDLNITIPTTIPSGNYYVGWIITSGETELQTANNTGLLRDNSSNNFSPLQVSVDNPEPTGACCFSDGTCATRTAAQCSSQSGVYAGNNVTCAAANCPQPGACCFDNGSCAIRTNLLCILQGGTYRGDGTTCATANCPQPGACCFFDGTCAIRTNQDCSLEGGAYRGDGTACASFNCPTVGTPLEIPAFGSSFNSATLTRGYWFVAPTDFIITGLRVPDETNHGLQNVEVVRLNVTPPTFSATTENFTSLARHIGVDSSAVISVNIPVSEGDIIGILGACGDSTMMHNSYAAVGPVETTILGQTTTLTRFGMQFNLVNEPARSLWSASGVISRIEMYYTGALGSGSLCTLPPNNGRTDNEAGAFFNLTPDNNMMVTGFDYYGGMPAGQVAAVEIWKRSGSYVPFIGGPAGWTLHERVDVIAKGSTNPTPVHLSKPLYLEGGTTTGIYFVGIIGGVRYFGTGTTSEPNQSNDDLAFYGEHARGAPMYTGPLFNPRAWSGCIYYTLIGDSMVFPNEYENAAGNTGRNTLVRDLLRTAQFVISSSDLGAIDPGTPITGMAWRQYTGGATAWPPSDVYWPDYQIEIATSANSPAAFSTTFANNIGADNTVVRTGPLTIPANAFPAHNPANFGPVIPFTTPFIYNGGDLVFTIRHPGNTAGINTFLDHLTATTPGWGTRFFYIDSTTPGATTGVAGTFPITQLVVESGGECYANCDGSVVPPILNVDDFTCFINAFAAGQALPHAQQITHYSNCDGSTIAPVLNVDDFTCFINAFAAGCP